MIEATPTTNELERIQALQAYQILDTKPEKEFDEITQLAANICETNMAAITLIDIERQWFKSVLGLNATETSRSVSFCGHAIHAPESVMVVADTSDDERFKDNPLVVEGPEIKSYAGAPIVDRNGRALGVLCVFDSNKKDFSEAQLSSLQSLSHLVMNQLQSRLMYNDLSGFLKLQSKDLKYKVEYTGKKEISAKQKEIDGLKAKLKALEESEKATKLLLNSTVKELKETVEVTVEATGKLEELNKHMPLGVSQSISLSSNLSKIKHSLLGLKRVAENAGIYEQVQNDELPEGGNVEAMNFLEEISTDDFSQLNKNKRVSFCIDNPALILEKPIQLVKTIMDVLVYNALAYSNFSSEVKIDCKETEDKVVFRVKDIGVGIPEEEQKKIFEPFFRASNVSISKGLGVGLSIAKIVTDKLGGELSFESKEGEGATFKLVLPKK
ncbi:GAF domain-containing protein [Roseivirga pacifica]|uniref:histidine kinase n=1 Tax=Roseivirga pacifica TaxID=1267423 RepID=A0A1I0QY96_9BACT|nr:ATP-binding protein [Roseivirga pacifica]RKQ42348.1 GAF domain-containing protein [Roseivirga pacifica]SEW32808.1 GAF domain-containing protein [Roseivirga pacifica]